MEGIKAANNRVLDVNLTTGKTDIIEISEKDRREYLGGKGLATKLLFDNIGVGVDPLSPDNIIVMMTGPTAEQLADFQGIAGAHTVGSEDGGPGIPLFGWSTVAGDLRVPHFVGLHALQLIPLAVFFLRTKISVTGVNFIGLGYLIVVGLLTAQALAGQSVVAPSPAFALGIIAAIAVPLTAALIRGPRAETDAESERPAPS